MARTDPRRACRHQLWLGYALVLAVIVLGVTAITAQFQHAAMCRVVAQQARELVRLKTGAPPITVARSVRADVPASTRSSSKGSP